QSASGQLTSPSSTPCPILAKQGWEVGWECRLRSIECSESMQSSDSPKRQINTPRQVLFASLVGTAIEFFDFYIYATAAVLVFPRLFFPPSDPASATLASLATFAIAFLSRPFGSALFGHFCARIGRKTSRVAV